jgi:outer membrane lipoprotein-sorting protein
MEHSMIRNSNIFTSLCVLTLMILIISNPAAADDPREIIHDMEQNVRGDASYNEMTMETVRPRYTREISLRSWTLGDDYSLIYITAPARDRGTAFLKRGNEIWNYQPQVDRTIRMPPSMMSQSWMGSDFTNDDLVGAASLIEDYTHELVGTETVDGHECYVIEMIPEPENPIVYEKVIYWVSKEHRLPVKVKNYDERDELVNSIHFREIKEMGGRMLPTLLEMIPADEDNRKTVLRTTKADFEINIAERFFSIENLTEVR